MSGVNQDIQATQGILGLFERSKEQIEIILDHLPMVLVIMDEEGRVLRGNAEAGFLFNKSLELLVECNLRELFLEVQWDTFRKNFTDLSNKATGEWIGFELSIGKTQNEMRAFLWNVLLVEYGRGFKRKIYYVLGKNIAELKKAISDNLELKKDLELAGAVQTLLMPKKSELITSQLELRSYYRSAHDAGGDWIWHCVRPDQSVLVLLGDVTGHGAGSAMITAIVAGSFLTFQQMNGNSSDYDNMPKLFKILDHNLKNFGAGGYWMTMSAIEVFPKERKVRYWNAGGPPVFMMDAKGHINAIQAAGSPLGADMSDIGKQEFNINPKDRIFMFTDGAFEINTNGNMNKLKGLRNLFSTTRQRTLEDTSNFISKSLVALLGSAQADDDIALVFMELSS